MNSSLDVKSVEKNNFRTNRILSRSEHEAFLPCSKIRPQLWWQEQRASWACLPLLPSLLLTPPPPLFCNALAHPANWTQSCKMSRISRIYPSEKVNRSGKCKNSFHLVYWQEENGPFHRCRRGLGARGKKVKDDAIKTDLEIQARSGMGWMELWIREDWDWFPRISKRKAKDDINRVKTSTWTHLQSSSKLKSLGFFSISAR